MTAAAFSAARGARFRHECLEVLEHVGGVNFRVDFIVMLDDQAFRAYQERLAV
ncbi:hypothetical protein D3C83_257970 [compost metagenome]